MENPTSPDLTRRPGVEARPICLADGNHWGLALPAPRLRPEVVEEVDVLGRTTRTIRLVAELGYPLEVRRLVENLRAACVRGDVTGQYEALMALGAALLCRAHDVDLIQAASLLEMDVEDLPDFVDAVLSIVSGGAPIAIEPRAGGKTDG